jgi:23S rRNA pseudouridine2605 synthase
MATKKTTPAKAAKKTAATKAPKKTATRKKKVAEVPEAEPETVIEAVAAPAAAEEETPEVDRNAEPEESNEDEPETAEPVAEEEPELEAEDEEDATDARPPAPAPHLERLQKILAQAGIASRRHAEELITTGRVQVNGQTVTALGSKADAARDHIRVDGKLLQGAERLRYFMLHKPKGYVTTVSDPENRATVMEFFSKTNERLYPVGRLDYLSEGLLLVTNDGELANSLTRAAAGVEKTYLVKVSGQPADEELDRLREGVAIDRGNPGEGRVRTAPARIRQVREGENPWFEVVLIEGRNRELRKMFEEIGHHVEKIRRVGYGPLVLDIPVGKTRELDPDEIEALRLTAAGKLKPRRLKTKKMLPKDAGKTVFYGDEESPRAGKKPFFKRPDAGGDRPERAGRFEKPAGRFEKRSGGFEKPSRSFEKRPGSFERPAGRFEKPAGNFEKRDRFERPGRFEKPAGGFEQRGRFDRPGRSERPAGRFEKPAGRFEKRDSFERPGRFEKPAGGFERQGRFNKPEGSGNSARFERPGKFQGNRPPQDRPFRPREERSGGEGRGFTPRNEEFQPRRGGSARFGRPEGGRTGNRRDDRGFRPDDRPQKPFRPTPERRRPFEIVEAGSEEPHTFSKPAGKPFRPFGDRPQRNFGDRPQRREGSSEGFRGKPGTGVGRPAGKSGFSDRPKSGFGGKPKSFGSKPSGGKSSGPRPGGFKKGPGFKSSGPRRSGGGSFRGKPGGRPGPGGNRGR